MGLLLVPGTLPYGAVDVGEEKFRALFLPLCTALLSTELQRVAVTETRTEKSEKAASGRM